MVIVLVLLIVFLNFIIYVRDFGNGLWLWWLLVFEGSVIVMVDWRGISIGLKLLERNEIIEGYILNFGFKLWVDNSIFFIFFLGLFFLLIVINLFCFWNKSLKELM